MSDVAGADAVNLAGALIVTPTIFISMTPTRDDGLGVRRRHAVVQTCGSLQSV